MSPFGKPASIGARHARLCLCILATTAAAAALFTQRASAQTPPPPLTGTVGCLPANDPQQSQPLLRVPELVTDGKRLNGTIVLTVETNRMKETKSASSTDCVLQYNRVYRGLNATLPEYPGTIPSGYPAINSFPGYVPPPPQKVPYTDPMPGPTFRAQVGNLVQLTFLNQVDPNYFGDSIDRGEREHPQQGCDESSGPYPYSDKFPDCFHGSSTGNIHFHGTHTSPTSTADNVFIEVRPSLRKDGNPVVTADSVKAAFAEFFGQCENELNKSQLAQWPTVWADLPKSYVDTQLELLAEYDRDPAIKRKLLPPDLEKIAQGQWPQYYIGAYPYCFRLPEFPTGAAPGAVRMGQAPGTHWYHAHKHGSTTINVANGMTGAFIIEGQYDRDLDAFYGAGWTRAQPIIQIQELSGSPILFSGGLGTGANKLDFTVNGRPTPTIAMKQGEVQLFRIINAAARSGAYFVKPTGGIEWKLTARDGVQLSPANYQKSQSDSFLMTGGNRVDMLVKAPNAPGTYPVRVAKAVNGAQVQKADSNAKILLYIVVGDSAASGPTSQFIPQAPAFPAFLADIAPSEVTNSKKIVFDSKTPTPTKEFPALAAGPPFTRHTIDGKEFNGEVGAEVQLNTVEEWTLVNTTANNIANPNNPPGQIDHPFHIHINPFQVFEVFDPNQQQRDSSGNLVAHYVFSVTAPSNLKPGSARELTTGQCWVNPAVEDTWRPCAPPTNRDLVWWDVFPIPSGFQANLPATTQQPASVVTIPGYFKMRSRFVDYAGQYVMHCHILAHEDRGMMTVVSVVPAGVRPGTSKMLYSHH